MDSESAALASAQQKHHKHMMFGKKQRYIEVFQCSGEDMNMVLNGGYQHQSPPAAITKPPLLSTGMLPARPQQPSQPLQISIPPPLTMSMPPQNSSLNGPLMAQQQAQFIAQQNLIARQQAAAAAAQLQMQQQTGMEQLFLQNFGFLPGPSAMGSMPNTNMHSSNPSNYPFSSQLQQFFYLPPRPQMLSMGNMGQMSLMPNMNMNLPYSSGPTPPAYASQGLPAMHHSQLQAQAILPNSAMEPSVKRSYDNAFRNDQMNLSAAKRAFHNAPSTSNIYGSYPYSQL